MKFEITVPVLNEEETLKEKIKETIEYLDKNFNINYVIIIADNGSTDNTEKYSKELEIKYSDKVKYLKVKEKGVGLALRTSWMQSKADYVGYMDLDLATDLKHFRDVFDLCNKSINIINGSRLLKESKVINRGIIREVTSRVFNFIVKFLLKTKFTDGMCGFKFLKKDIAKELIETGIVLNGWFFSTELLVKSEWKGYKIVEIPVIWTDDKKSKVKILKLSLEYLKNIWRLYKTKKEWIDRYGK